MENRKFEDDVLSIEVKYSKEKDNPIDVFEACKLMFESIINTQTELIRNINPLLNVEFVLSDVKAASIWAFLTRKTITVEEQKETLLVDETIGDLNKYVNKSTELIVQKMANSKDKTINNNDINEIQDKIVAIAKETRISETSNYHAPSKFTLANAFENAEKATRLLSPESSFDFIQDTSFPISINKIYSEIDKKELLEENDSKIIEKSISTTLKIKIADFLGTTKWKFLTEDNKTIDAKIDDDGWLENFHNNTNTALSSGDSLKIDGVIRETFDKKGNLINTEYTIKKIKGIVRHEKQRNFEE